jgi:predicted ATPase/DNA-binding winged helix-turn-helix (wHTH) protein
MRYTFAECELDLQTYTLRRAGQRVHLRPKALQMLVYLLAHAGRVIPKHELYEQVWPGQVVSDATLESTIAVVRRALGDSAQHQRCIRTFHGIGYRFVAPVVVSPVALPDPTPPPGPPAPQSPAPEATLPTAARGEFRGEYKVVTVLCGVVSPEHSRAAGLALDELYVFVRALHELLQRVMQPYAGTVYRLDSAGFTVVFGAPQAQEDHTQRGLLAALELQRQWPALVAGVVPPSGTALCLGLGVHTGPVVVEATGHHSTTPLIVVGEVPLLAAHLAQQAVPGTLLLSAATLRLAPAAVACEALPSLLVPGHATLLEVYQVREHASVPAVPRWERCRSHYVGRQAELAALHTGLARAREGQGHVIGVVGEAGMGKSRLLAEFRCEVVAQGVRYLASGCESYGQGTPYLPLRPLVQQVCGLHETDTPARHAATVRTCLAGLGLAADDWTPWLLHLLGLADDTGRVSALSPQARQRQTFEALHQFLLESCQHQPLIVAVENLHWSDATSAACLGALVQRLDKRPLLLLTTYRPGYQPPWAMTAPAMQVALSPLGARDSQHIVQGMLGRQQIPAAMLQQIVAQANGNPLFLEELAQAVREQSTATLPQTVPDTLQAVLAARLDRLPADAKRLLQAAAVIGSEMAEPLLAALFELPEDLLGQQLQLLQAGEFLYQTRLAPVPVYTFKHALIREAAYQSLVTPIRQHYHGRIAQVLMERFPETVTTRPELLAHHYTEAGLGEQALGYWYSAGEHAMQRSAHTEAIRHFTKGLEVLKTLPDTPTRVQQELQLHVALGTPLIMSKGYAAPEVVQTYARARALCQQVGETPQLLPVLWGLFTYYFVRAELPLARALSVQLLRLAQSNQDAAFTLEAHYALGSTLFHLGDIVPARTHLEQGIAQATPPKRRSRSPQDLGMACRSCATLVLWFLGYPEQALRQAQETLRTAQELSHAYSLVFALVLVAIFHQLRREPQAVQALAEAAIPLATEQGFPYWQAQGMMLRGWALTLQGHGTQGLPQLRQGLAMHQATGAVLGRPYFLALLAEACGHLGQIEEALALLAEAQTEIEHTQDQVYEAELYRLKGECLLRAGAWPLASHATEATACFRQAMAVAQRQQAKSLELRAAVNLSRLWQQQGNRAAARELLATVYGWFTEGFDTADLQAAQTLLTTLREEAPGPPGTSRLLA